jgi:hypothetical protein
VLAAVLAVQVVLGGALVWAALEGFPFLPGTGGADSTRPGAAAAQAPRARVDRFDSARAFALLRMQVAQGPRPAGSPASRRLAQRLRRLLPGGRFEAVPPRFARGQRGLRNVVGRLPGRRPAVLIGAHYDTEDLPGFVGANDGAGGTAAVIELARALARHRRAGSPELRFVLFDGEESPPGAPDDQFERYGLRGSRAYAAAHARELRAAIVLDLVADRDLTLPREEGSDPALWSRLRAAARRAGVGPRFPARTVPRILDDHTPFAARGVPAIDLIDFDYPCWHRPCDDLSRVSPRSLDAAGEAVLELVRGF